MRIIVAKKTTGKDSFDNLMENLRSKYSGTKRIRTGTEILEDDVNVIPTGVVLLDTYLQGGFPEGKMVDLYGAPGSGKCLPSDANVWTELGLMTVRELFEFTESNMFDFESEQEVVFPLINRNGEVENTSLFTTNGPRKLVEVVTETGRFIRSTKNHPHLVSREDGSEEWVLASDLQPGDKLIRQDVYDAVSLENCTLYNFTEDQAYVIGVLTARGMLNAQGKPELIDSMLYPATELELYFTAEGWSGMDLMPETTQEFPDVTKDYPQFANVHAVYGAWGTYPKTLDQRDIPLNIRLNDKDTLVAFVRGVVESTGEINKDGLVLKLESKTLAAQLKLVLELFGVLSYVEEKRLIEGLDRSDWELRIPNTHINQYLSVFGMVWEDFWADALKTDYSELETLGVPTFDSVVRVVEIEDEKLTFDFTLDDTHSFLVEGITTHNTGIALSFLANVQRLTGKPCVYLDQENAYDPKLAALLGVNIDDLIVIHLPSAEEVLQFMVDAARTNEVGCIILDSATNLSSEAEIHGEIGDATVGKVGRLLAQAIRVIDSIKTDTTIIFINQTYANIGAMGHAPKTVAGGGSKIKFAASTRLHVQRYGKHEEGGEVVGHKMQVTIDKSRFSPSGGQKFLVNVIYGVGYDNEEDILDAGVEAGILLKGAGGWITDTRTGERWHGAPKFKGYLREEQEFRDSLLDAINEALAG